MIYDTIANRHRYAGNPGIAEALDALAALDPSALPDEPVQLSDGAGHVGVSRHESRNPADVRFEAHRVFADVHAVLEGEERLEVAAVSGLHEETDYDEAEDVSFHAGATDVTVTLRPGWFAIVFPGEAHRPGLWIDGPRPVTKAVAKVRAS